MEKQIIFTVILLLTLAIFGFTVKKYIFFFRITRKFRITNWNKRINNMFRVAVFQSKIFRKPFSGILHALVFWGFIVITIGSMEMVFDGIFGKERIFASLGIFYEIITFSGDVMALIVLIAILIFTYRRLFSNIKRFSGIEMKEISHTDAIVALSIIFLLMVSLLGMNTFYIQKSGNEICGNYPISNYFSTFFVNMEMNQIIIYHEIFWWMHILLIFIFANLLPYSKHFHVFMSVPNVLLSRIEPLGKLENMENVTHEVRLMLFPDSVTETPAEVAASRFGVLDVEDVTWKNYLDSLACTECGRCTSVCPANTTGKMLSPRKIMMNLRARMKEKGLSLMKNGLEFNDNKSLSGDYISAEELWACTTCNACAAECPININHPSLIVDLRRYLVMEKSAAPYGLNSMFSNIENNGAPWQFSFEDRLNWTTLL